ncbi:hypothetical protein ASO20_02710 [Mycoplasma sp. (ex Biomphalaria glabrata)]|uniref:hypothetical protein n=1 Tax=Mycoplasma sp. (ex Biomphalaria glabrata) TaxID=1749074 RepID=UPI00073A5B98|nr:hypothetical protein [Mycoplasma sp. (ex Biomphalaria glabrata)]ALV23546.1 hypothetical protein ASO20_02710 [Mycoplasma sp. (ex Biomphalaria glabrata)]
MELQIFKVIEEVLSSFELYLWNIKQVEKSDGIELTIFVDKKDGEMDSDLCYKAHKEINYQLQSSDELKKYWVMELCSAGSRREVENDLHLQKSINKKIEIRLRDAYEGKYSFSGKLLDFSNNVITLETLDKVIKLARGNVKKINWIIN